VAADGSLSNKRRFAEMNVSGEVMSAPKPDDRFNSSGDGTAVDTDGRYYVATKTGLQIFEPDGTFVGTIWAPQYPVNITFGGPDNSTLYMVGESSVWMVPTRVHGFRNPAGK
jgi:gluconolactonase